MMSSDRALAHFGKPRHRFLAVLSLSAGIVRDPSPEIPFWGHLSSKLINFYPPTEVQRFTGDWLTNNDDDPGRRYEMCRFRGR